MCYSPVLYSRCGRWCVILCLLLRCGSMLFKCEFMSSCRFDRQQQQQHRNKRSRGECLDRQSQSNVDSTKQRRSRHAASCRFVDLGWWERRCRCDSIECELDAASSVPFKIKSSHCIGLLLMSFEQRLQYWQQCDRLYDQGQSGLACLQRTIRELVCRSYCTIASE